MTDRKTRTANTVLPRAGLNGFVWTFVQDSTFVLRLNFCTLKPALLQAANPFTHPTKKPMKKFPTGFKIELILSRTIPFQFLVVLVLMSECHDIDLFQLFSGVFIGNLALENIEDQVHTRNNDQGEEHGAG